MDLPAYRFRKAMATDPLMPIVSQFVVTGSLVNFFRLCIADRQLINDHPLHRGACQWCNLRPR